MTRDLGGGDIAAIRHVGDRAIAQGADVLHGHGAKGGAYARLARGSALRVYTPHGGSLHYRWTTLSGALYLAAEAILKRRTDLFLFESDYGRATFAAKIGAPERAALVRVVHNGVAEAEFSPVAPASDATDLLFVGELRQLKGVDVLIDALAIMARDGHRLTATIVGDGPDRAAFESAVAMQNLRGTVRFVGAKPARAAFALGRMLVLPSRAESLPYVLLEAAAAGLPIVASKVGGIPEIVGPDTRDLVPPANPAALASAIMALKRDPDTRAAAALRLQARARASFSLDAMTEGVLDGYQEAMAARR
jgi:glycosyltransferase involved in cell wall biosynthesis